MPSGNPHCSACNHPVTSQTGANGDQFRCEQCSLPTRRDGEPFLPTECGRCRSKLIEWTGLYYDCPTCKRHRYGPYPRTRGFYREEPENGYQHWAPGVVQGTLAGQPR